MTCALYAWREHYQGKEMWETWRKLLCTESLVHCYALMSVTCRSLGQRHVLLLSVTSYRQFNSNDYVRCHENVALPSHNLIFFHKLFRTILSCLFWNNRSSGFALCRKYCHVIGAFSVTPSHFLLQAIDNLIRIGIISWLSRNAVMKMLRYPIWMFLKDLTSIAR